MANKLDTLLLQQTPEGIILSLSPAGPLVRGFAWLIDFGLRLLLYIILGMGLSWAGGIGTGLILIGIFCIEWFYPVLFEIRSGMTPGKKMLGVRVVHDDGTPVALPASLIRNLIRCVDILPLFNMVGMTTMLFTSHFKRLGDLAAGTLVVYRSDLREKADFQQVEPRPPSVPLKLWQQRLILDFCERSRTLSAERRTELATLVPELTRGRDPEPTLLAYGNWFLRGKTK